MTIETEKQVNVDLPEELIEKVDDFLHAAKKMKPPVAVNKKQAYAVILQNGLPISWAALDELKNKKNGN